MKDIVIPVLAAIALFLVWNGKQVAHYDDGGALQGDRVPPDVTQVILEKVQGSDPNIVPLETLFINHAGDGVYNSRFMFFNTKGFFGSQYDVQAKVNANGSVQIMSQTESARADYSRAYKPDQYRPWTSVQDSLDAQFSAALKNPVTGPPLESYKPTLR